MSRRPLTTIAAFKSAYGEDDSAVDETALVPFSAEDGLTFFGSHVSHNRYRHDALPRCVQADNGVSVFCSEMGWTSLAEWLDSLQNSIFPLVWSIMWPPLLQRSLLSFVVVCDATFWQVMPESPLLPLYSLSGSEDVRIGKSKYE